MNFYIWSGVTLFVLSLLFLFYDWAYERGYNAYRGEVTDQINACLTVGRLDLLKAGEAVQKTQKQLERKKTHDEICRDILQFDIRHCL